MRSSCPSGQEVRAGPGPQGGAAIGKAHGAGDTLVLAEGHARAADIAFGMAMRAYDFDTHKTGEKTVPGPVTLMAPTPRPWPPAAAPMAAVAEGVFFTRDLVNEPANVLTTHDFAARLAAMQELGLDVEILDEEELMKLGMGALLGVGQGSESPSKVVVMQWHGGPKGEAPFALIGKGVVFDTGGISIKPAAGMEEMTMDMGGAGVVAGVMRTLALRKAKANVVGLVGPGREHARRSRAAPGRRGEIDEGRHDRGDQHRCRGPPRAGRRDVVRAGTLQAHRDDRPCHADRRDHHRAGATRNTGVFSNNDDLCNAFLAAAKAEGEGAWRMPMGDAYDAKLKSRIADMMNVGGRDGGARSPRRSSCSASSSPRRPGATSTSRAPRWPKGDTALAPKGATGWGVMALTA
jgi:leucyl aminopeptidase